MMLCNFVFIIFVNYLNCLSTVIDLVSFNFVHSFVDYSNEGLVMNAETSPELRRRIMTATATKDPNRKDAC